MRELKEFASKVSSDSEEKGITVVKLGFSEEAKAEKPGTGKQQFRMKDFKVSHTIGTGSSATVKCAVHRTKMRVAMKMYDKYKLKEAYVRKAFKREVQILEAVSHPNIVKLYQVIDEPKTINLVMEYLGGSSL